jgi:hypothetical protein
VRVRGDFGFLVYNVGQTQGKDGSDPLAALADRKIREREIRHGISYRVNKTQAEIDSALPGYVCRGVENEREGFTMTLTKKGAYPLAVVVHGETRDRHLNSITQ